MSLIYSSILLLDQRRTRRTSSSHSAAVVAALVSILVMLSMTMQSTQAAASAAASSSSSSSFHRRRALWGRSVVETSSAIVLGASSNKGLFGRVMVIIANDGETTQAHRLVPSAVAADCNNNNALHAARILRGGAKAKKSAVIEEEEEEAESDVGEENEEEEEEGDGGEYDDEEEEEDEEEEVQETTKSSIVKKKKSSAKAVAAAVYDEPLVPSPFANLFCTFGVMMLARKVDLFHPTIVRIARFAFITYLVVLQLFVFYVRIQAKLRNDRTMIELTNPLSSVLRNQLGGGGSDGADVAGAGAGMMKNLASSLLSSQSTIMDYDLKQALSMQSGLIFNMIVMWFLHFKMEQVQPLLVQTGTGFLNLVYSPLFQAYIMNRNLQRPFQNPSLPKAPIAEEKQEAATGGTAVEQQLSTKAKENEESSSSTIKVSAKGSKQDDDEEEEEESDSEEVNVENESDNDDRDDDNATEAEAEAEAVVVDETEVQDLDGGENDYAASDVSSAADIIDDNKAEAVKSEDTDSVVDDGDAAVDSVEEAVDDVEEAADSSAQNVEEKNHDNEAINDTKDAGSQSD